MAAAASVILAVVLLWPSTKGDYLERLGRTEMISTTERGGNADSLFQQAAVYFNQQQFDKALPLLDKAVKEDSSSQLALFYRGVAAWHTGAMEAARKDLEQVYKGGSLLQYEAAFYLALGYAGQKDKASAKEWLARIPEGTSVAEKARELARKLE
jgi:tetratricopeptide (TPR) repeat protein